MFNKKKKRIAKLEDEMIRMQKSLSDLQVKSEHRANLAEVKAKQYTDDRIIMVETELATK